MNKSTVSVLLAAFAVGACITTTAATKTDTHPQGVVDIKVTNMSHSNLKVGGWKCAPHTFGSEDIEFTVKKDTLTHAKLGYKDEGSYVVKYDFDKHIMPVGHWGSSVAFKKAFKGKDGLIHYSVCKITVAAGPGKSHYEKSGKLCKHVDIKTSFGPGSTSYLHATYK